MNQLLAKINREKEHTWQLKQEDICQDFDNGDISFFSIPKVKDQPDTHKPL